MEQPAPTVVHFEQVSFLGVLPLNENCMRVLQPNRVVLEKQVMIVVLQVFLYCKSEIV